MIITVGKTNIAHRKNIFFIICDYITNNSAYVKDDVHNVS